MEELKKADAVVLTYACDKPATLDRLSTFWLPELRRLEVCTKNMYSVNSSRKLSGMLHNISLGGIVVRKINCSKSMGVITH